ncbi:hypothetical protein GCM10007897_25520 [Sphingobium jiangsuense]|uniref:Outer membrane immunogenic protein n=1 Tax=Sphingobium jiangsuense TaxID=870476 RepID=A0A7W6BQS5_9SPHN|nr:porin family protein [Sphingobium jiangsuense]MBB3928330.1 outer membrane immunogenic protein [Sphingobium jiangsuense]GLT01161.1 hypothetical protein GCM10007897_25520 [Sphingobium jiangsuense]
MKKIAVAALAASVFALPAVAHAGGYIQVQGGLDAVSALDESKEGFAYGAAVGYDVPVSSNMFVGVEGSVDDSSTKYCIRSIDVVGDKACLRTGRDLSVVARVGTNLSEAGQLYVLAGYTNARLRLTYDDGATGANNFAYGENGDGLRLGAGYKHNFGQNLFGKIEYRYSNYESDISRHNVLAAVGFNF